MPSPYQEFVRKAKERFQENQKKKLQPRGGIEFTTHARYKMSQYSLSEQKVKGVIRNPRRTQKGIAPKTAAVMQPVSPKRIAGKPARPGDTGRSGGESWKQEIWVMYQKQTTKNKQQKTNNLTQDSRYPLSGDCYLKIISAWRYPGMSPKGSPIPEEILQELADESIL